MHWFLLNPHTKTRRHWWWPVPLQVSRGKCLGMEHLVTSVVRTSSPTYFIPPTWCKLHCKINRRANRHFWGSADIPLQVSLTQVPKRKLQLHSVLHKPDWWLQVDYHAHSHVAPCQTISFVLWGENWVFYTDSRHPYPSSSCTRKAAMRLSNRLRSQRKLKTDATARVSLRIGFWMVPLP